MVAVAVAVRMLATEIEAYEDDTRLHFDVESDLPRFLNSVLQRTDQISQTKVDEEIVEQHIVVLDQTVRSFVYPGTPLGIFWVGMCCPGLQIGTPFEQKISPKTDTPF